MKEHKSEQGIWVRLTPEKVAAIKAEALMGRPYANRVSLALAFRLLSMADRHFDPFGVLHELDQLEGNGDYTLTKAALPFTKAPLSGFWHKHFFSAHHLVRNINLRWNVRGGGNKAFDQLIDEVAREHGNHPARWQAVLAHRLTFGAYKERASERRLTGDWIIYAVHEGTNYCLDLATHEEAKAYGDERLYEKLQAGSAAEFPFLFRDARQPPNLGDVEV
ncbi:hypothetical protein [Paraburkholderia adhaesiva]|uniref:hypothetical protein n=1 Tax=Paraburkholderia adhaesiva TaxID=2883244 RepID=UPI001F450871|nr:hypothetical protein [Paraburkholderia adhaesiva]